MKLDRNTNLDGKGKYALINLRTDKVEWGGPHMQFFVRKYSDPFAAPALWAYARAVNDLADATTDPSMRAELIEWAEEIDREANLAASWPKRKIPD